MMASATTTPLIAPVRYACRFMTSVCLDWIKILASPISNVLVTSYHNEVPIFIKSLLIENEREYHETESRANYYDDIVPLRAPYLDTM
jgi:hypothetical protein